MATAFLCSKPRGLYVSVCRSVHEVNQRSQDAAWCADLAEGRSWGLSFKMSSDTCGGLRSSALVDSESSSCEINA